MVKIYENRAIESGLYQNSILYVLFLKDGIQLNKNIHHHFGSGPPTPPKSIISDDVILERSLSVDAAILGDDPPFFLFFSLNIYYYIYYAKLSKHKPNLINHNLNPT